MGIGRNNRIAGTFIGLIAVSLFGARESWSFERTSGIWKVLRAGHFSRPMNDEARAWPIKGSIVAKGKRYKFWRYEWEEKRTAGHGATLLLVFEKTNNGLSYLGHYEFEGISFKGPVHPEIRGKTIFFPYPRMEFFGSGAPVVSSFENGPPAELFPGTVDKFVR